MKRSALWMIALLGIAIPFALRAQDWKPQNSMVNVTLRSVHFVSEHTGYIVGDKGTILRTKNGGKDWATLPSPMSANNLHDIFFSNSDTLKGWAVGRDTLLYTLNGGNTWQAVKLPNTDDPRGIHMVDDQQGWIVCIGGNSYRIQNGGSSLEPKGTIAGIQNSMYKVHFLTKDQGFALGDKGLICRTLNGSSPNPSWTALAQNTGISYRAITFAGASQGWAVGFSSSGNRVIAHSTDGGTSWSVPSISAKDTLQDVFAFDADNVWAVGWNGLILKKVPGAQSWSVVTSGTTLPLRGVHFPVKEIGWAVGDNGVILKYDPSGVASLSIAASDASPCAGDTVTLQALAPVQDPVWTLPGGAKVNAPVLVLSGIQASQAGLYTLQGTINGQQAQGSITLSVLPLPDLSANGAILPCNGEPVELVALGSGTFSWNGPNGFQATGSGIVVSDPGNYTVSLTGANGCSAAVTVELKPPADAPVVTIQAPLGTTITCTTTQLPLNGTSNLPNVSYQWFLNGNPLSKNKSLLTASTGQYLLVVTESASGCTGSASIIINASQNPPPVEWDTLQTNITCRNSTVVFRLQENPSIAALSWKGPELDGATAFRIVTDKPGTYQLTVTGTNGCTTFTSFVVSIDTIAPVILGTATTFADCSNSRYGIQASGQPADGQFQWFDPNGQPLPSGANAEVEAPGVYTVVLTRSNGCTAQATHRIDQADADSQPTVITPNGDGKNDRLEVAFCGGSASTVALTVFNRWGQVIHRAADYRNDWPQGKDTDLATGQYFYVLEYEGAESRYPLTVLSE